MDNGDTILKKLKNIVSYVLEGINFQKLIEATAFHQKWKIRTKRKIVVFIHDKKPIQQYLRIAALYLIRLLRDWEIIKSRRNMKLSFKIAVLNRSKPLSIS